MSDDASGSAGASGSAELTLAVYSGPLTAWFCGVRDYHGGVYHRSTVDFRRFWDFGARGLPPQHRGFQEQSADLRPLGGRAGGFVPLGALGVAALEVFWLREVSALEKYLGGRGEDVGEVDGGVWLLSARPPFLEGRRLGS